MKNKFLYRYSLMFLGLGMGLVAIPSSTVQAKSCSNGTCPFRCACDASNQCVCSGGAFISALSSGSDIRTTSCNLTGSGITATDGRISYPSLLNLTISVTKEDGTTQDLYYQGAAYSEPTSTTTISR